jgi:hypothetical protein
MPVSFGYLLGFMRVWLKRVGRLLLKFSLLAYSTHDGVWVIMLGVSSWRLGINLSSFFLVCLHMRWSGW